MQNGVFEDLLSKCESGKFLETEEVLEICTFFFNQKTWFWLCIKPQF